MASAPASQAFLDKGAHPQYRSFASTTRYIVDTEGAPTLFAGLVPRALRLMCAVIILNGVRNALVQLVDDRRSLAALEAARRGSLA